jgi:hypothetical protein
MAMMITHPLSPTLFLVFPFKTLNFDNSDFVRIPTMGHLQPLVHKDMYPHDQTCVISRQTTVNLILSVGMTASFYAGLSERLVRLQAAHFVKTCQ